MDRLDGSLHFMHFLVVEFVPSETLDCCNQRCYKSHTSSSLVPLNFDVHPLLTYSSQPPKWLSAQIPIRLMVLGTLSAEILINQRLMVWDSSGRRNRLHWHWRCIGSHRARHDCSMIPCVPIDTAKNPFRTMGWEAEMCSGFVLCPARFKRR